MGYITCGIFQFVTHMFLPSVRVAFYRELPCVIIHTKYKYGNGEKGRERVLLNQAMYQVSSLLIRSLSLDLVFRIGPIVCP